MSVTNTSEVSNTNVSTPVETFIDDIKDHLLQNLDVRDLERFKLEIDAELTIRRTTVDRYNKYRIEIENAKQDFMKKKEEELNKLRKELESSKIKLRKQVIKEEIEEEEEEEEEEYEEPVKYKKRNNKKKS